MIFIEWKGKWLVMNLLFGFLHSISCFWSGICLHCSRMVFGEEHNHLAEFLEIKRSMPGWHRTHRMK